MPPAAGSAAAGDAPQRPLSLEEPAVAAPLSHGSPVVLSPPLALPPAVATLAPSVCAPSVCVVVGKRPRTVPAEAIDFSDACDAARCDASSLPRTKRQM
eukprot:2254378-Prymnesium_polylepis.1